MSTQQEETADSVDDAVFDETVTGDDADTEAEDAEAYGDEAESAETVASEAGNTESSQADPVESEAIENEVIESEIAESEIVESESSEELELEAIASGKCGDHATWRLDDNKTLYIEGSGAVTSHEWTDKYRDTILALNISNDITSLPDYAFYDCSNLVTVSGGSGLQSIGDHAFAQCIRMTRFEPSNMVEIDRFAFYDCRALTSFTADKVTSLGELVFMFCGNLKRVSFNSLTVIPGQAFKICDSLTDISFSSAITVGESAFGSCDSLVSVTMNKVTEVGNHAFSDCRKLTNVSLPAVTKIGDSAFNGCSALTTVNVDQVTDLRDYAFEYCSSLKSIAVDRLTHIPNYAFGGCTALTNVSMRSVTSIGFHAFSNCENLTTISSLNNVERIESSAFSYCKKLTSVSLNSILTIGDNAFNNCVSLTRVIIGNQVASIDARAFSRCSKLKKVILLNDSVYIGDDCFNDAITIYGYRGSTAEEFAEGYCGFVPLEKAAVEKVYGFVTRLYQVCLSRNPDVEGLNNWAATLITQERTGIQTAYGFIFSNEFKNKNYCNNCYVERLYQAFMGRGSDSAGKASWIRQLESGKTREAVFNVFALSNEFKKICSAAGIAQGSGISVPVYGTVPKGTCASCGAEDGVTAFVKRLYEICLSRTPDAGGLANWTNALWNHSKTGSGVAYGFIFSDEFQKKNLSNTAYVEYLYRAFFGREADAAGKASWVRQLNNGTSRRSVFNGFVGSQEFSKLCAKYGIVRD